MLLLMLLLVPERAWRELGLNVMLVAQALPSLNPRHSIIMNKQQKQPPTPHARTIEMSCIPPASHRPVKIVCTGLPPVRAQDNRSRLCMMSNIYHTEPATHGKVLLHTSFGDIDIELWGKECPKACRNFVQLAM